MWRNKTWDGGPLITLNSAGQCGNEGTEKLRYDWRREFDAADKLTSCQLLIISAHKVAVFCSLLQTKLACVLSWKLMRTIKRQMETNVNICGYYARRRSLTLRLPNVKLCTLHVWRSLTIAPNVGINGCPCGWLAKETIPNFSANEQRARRVWASCWGASSPSAEKIEPTGRCNWCVRPPVPFSRFVGKFGHMAPCLPSPLPKHGIELARRQMSCLENQGHFICLNVLSKSNRVKPMTLSMRTFHPSVKAGSSTT